MRGRLQRKLNNKSGFTLAETLVALAISIILLAITMVGILHYYKNMKLTEMDNTAKEIFIAAQNHLTAADASGELKRYREKALDKKTTEDERRAALGTLMDKPSDVPDGIDWPADNEEYYYVDYNIPSGTTVNLDGSILQYMLPFGAIDETVRADGKYIIEYNVETATVYGVFYAEEDVDFSYLDIAWLNNKGGRTDDANGRHTRRDYDKGIIGYYGGAMAGNLLSGPTSDLKMDIENGDTLKVTVIDPNYFNKATDGTSMLQTHLTLYVKGKESGNEVKFTLDLKDSATPEKEDKKKDLWWDVKAEGLIDDTTKEKKKGLVYTITLDDITRPGGHFADIFPEMMPGEDIIIKVVSASSTALATVREAEGMTNSLFELVTYDEKKKLATASIGFLRHLENLDPEVSKLSLKTDPVKEGTEVLYTPTYLVKKAEQIRDMSYKNFFGKDEKNRKSVYKAGFIETDGVDVGKLSDASYHGIRNDQLLEYDGKNHKISDVYINNRNTTETGEYKLGDMNGGIFRYLYLGSHNFTAKDLILENFDVTAVKNSAAFAAEINWTNGSSGNTCNLSNILVDGGTISSSHPQGNSGGLIGYTGVKSIVKNCAAVVKSVATGARIPEKENYKYAGDAGGLIGEINSKGSLVENCYSGGMTKDGVYKHDDPSDYNVRGVDMAGGLIGKLNGKSNTIDNCYSTCSVYVANSGEPGISYAGGLVGGELSSSDKGTHTYKDCYAIGFVGGDDSAKRGAFIGNAASSSSTYTGCKFLMGINPVSVRASGSGNLSGVFETPVGDLKVEDINETHEKDPALKGKMYPFATVNKTGMTRYDNQAAKGVHYGDWQELDEEAVTGGLLFAYRETVENKDYWYIVKAEKNAAGTEYSTVANTLLKKENTYVDDDNCNYGYLSDQNQINSLFDKETKKLKDLVNTNGEKVGNVDELEGEYYFFQVNNSVEQDSDGIVEMPEAKDEISFYFNPDFAAAIGAESDLGTQKTPYQVRTNQQLRNIAKGGYENVYRDKDYSQSLDIKLTKESFKPFGGAAFTGTYNALYKDEQGYEINNFTQNINGEGKKAGLITEIGSKGKVSYVNLHGEITAKETYNHIGSLTGSMRGTAEGCYSDVSLEIDNNNRYSGGDINIGGLVGYVMPEAIMEGCHYLTIYNTSGSPFSVDNSVPNSINIGGLVGYNSGIITNSSAEVKISSTPYNVQGQVGVGGFVGKNTNGGKISYSWAKTLFEMSVVDNNASFGSFAGIISGDAEISNSYAILNWCSASASGAFVGKNGIGENDSSIVQNCHAVELDNWNNMNLNSSLKFVDGNSLKEDANCYRYHNSYSSEPGVKYILTLADYKTLSKFTGFDDSIWEVTNDKYPTLIANPEPKVSKARAQSIFKRSLEENLQPKLDIDNEPFQELDNAG